MRKNIKLTFVLSFILLTTSTITTRGSVFENLSGTWQGTGVVSKMDSKIEMKWERVLDGKFWKLSFVNEMKGANGAIKFEGVAFYKTVDKTKTAGTWFDSFGLIRPIDAMIETDRLVSNWGTVETELGSTIYRLTAENSLEVVDSVKSKDGTWREFGRSTLSRISK